MKSWKYLLLIPFLTATLSAQIPSFGGYAYPQPYPPLWAYPLERLSPSNDAIDSLTQQVQQLSEQVRQLQAELAAAQAQAQQAQQALARAVEPPPATPPAPETILVLKNGQRITSQGFAVAGNTLWAITPSGSERIAVSSLDVRTTQQENLQRGIQFPDIGK